MRKTKSTTINRSTPQSYYHRPQWDDAEFGTEFCGDTLQKLAWSGLRDRSSAELANFLHYLMWVLSTRHTGHFSYSMDVFDWAFEESRFDSFFSFEVHVMRDGQRVADFEACADIDGRLTWLFSARASDYSTIDLSKPLDLISPSDVRQATDGLSESIEISLQPKELVASKH